LDETFTILKHEGIQVHKGTDASGTAICNPANDAPAIRVTTQYDVREFLPFDEVHYILDMRFQIHFAGQKVGTLP
jgi:hypothetical protein